MIRDYLSSLFSFARRRRNDPAGAELADSRLRDVLANTRQGIVITDGTDRIALVNQVFLDTYFPGEERRVWRERDWVGATFKDICREIIRSGMIAVPDGIDIETMLDAGCTARTKGNGVGIEQNLSNGRHVVAATSRMRDGGFLTIVHDVSEAVQKSRQLALIADNLPGVIAYLDTEQRIKFINKTGELWHKRPAGEIIGRRFKDIVPADYYEFVSPLMAGALAGEPQRAECRATLADGQTRFVQVHYIPDFGGGRSVVGYFAMATDVSEVVRKAEQLKLIMDNIPALVAYADRAGYLRYINNTGEQWHGQPRNTLLDRPLSEVVPPDYYQAAKPMIEAVHAGRPQRAELPRTGDDGIEHRVDTSWVPDFAPNGEVMGHFVIGMDISEASRKANELAVITNSLPGFIGYVDANERYRWINRTAETWLGRPSSEVIGKSLKDMLLPEHYERLRPYVQAVLAGEPQIWEYEAPYPDGSRRWLEARLIPDFGPGQNVLGYFGLVLDITERRELHQQLAQAQKMEAVGQLTAGVAHDFNNLLGVMLGNLDLARLALADRPRESGMIGRAIEAVEKGGNLTQRLLSFSRRQTLLTRDCDINELVRGMSEFLVHTIGRAITVKTILADDLWLAFVDPAQLENAIVNLAINAKDAMPDGGALTIETSNMELDAASAIHHDDAQPGDYVKIEISDTGTGMPPEIMSRVFEPFFTTKEVGKGTGLGLSMVYGFVKQSGGYVTVASTEGQGTTIGLHLPRKRVSAAHQPRLAGAALTH